MKTRIPCPYQPFSLPCLLSYGHRRPHKIQVEAAYVEKHDTSIAEKAAKDATDALKIELFGNVITAGSESDDG